jgi:hypothetical protein
MGLGSSDGIVVRRPAMVGCGWSPFPLSPFAFGGLWAAGGVLWSAECGDELVGVEWDWGNGGWEVGK